jgi:hypothetical protein
MLKSWPSEGKMKKGDLNGGVPLGEAGKKMAKWQGK